MAPEIPWNLNIIYFCTFPWERKDWKEYIEHINSRNSLHIRVVNIPNKCSWKGHEWNCCCERWSGTHSGAPLVGVKILWFYSPWTLPRSCPLTFLGPERDEIVLIKKVLCLFLTVDLLATVNCLWRGQNNDKIFPFCKKCMN